MADTAPAPSPHLAQALAYLERGWPVFPVCRPIREGRCVQHGECGNAGKRPLVRWEAYQTRLPTIDEVTAWWTRDRTANIGMATGGLSGIVVLDCDGPEARKAALDQGVPATPAVFTGKPGGIHYHLSHPGFAVQNFARKGAAGLDFRGDGGYVLLPSSHHARGADYRWVDGTEGQPLAVPPDWLLDLIHAPRVASDPDATHTGLDLDLVLAGIPEGQRDETLWRYACRLRSENVPLAFAELFVRQAARACQPPFDEDSAAEKVQRAYREYLPTLTLEVGAPLAPAPAPTPYLVKQIGESRSVAAAVPPALLQGLLWSGKVHWLYSAPGAGKTMLMLAAAMHVAAGQPFGDRRVEPGAVLLIEEDSPESVLGEYVTTLGEMYPALPMDTMPLYYNAVQGLRLTDADGLEKIRAAVAACPIPPRLVVVDTCEKVLPSQDFTSRELAPLVTLCQELTARGIALVVIDHTRKSPPVADKSKRQTDPSDDQLIDLLYGGRQKSGMSDVMLYFTGSLTRGKLAGRFVKFRGATPDPVTLTWAGDTGFCIVEPPRRARTPSEEKALKWINSGAPPAFANKDLCAGTGLTEVTAKRVLGEFLRRNWVSQSGDGRGVKYTVNDIAMPSILEL